MPRFFNKLKDVAGTVLTTPIPEAFSRLTPNSIESSIPDAFKELWSGTPETRQAARSGSKLAAFNSLLAADEAAGGTLARVFGNRTVGPINIEDLMTQILRPSNLVPVSRSASLLKAGKYGPPLLVQLAREGAFSGAFSGAETLRKGGNAKEASLSTALGFGAGAVTPLALHGVGAGISRLRGRGAKVPAVPIEDVGGLPQRKTRVSRMTPEEALAAGKAVSPDQFAIQAQKNIDYGTTRIAQLESRLRNPLQERPPGKTGGTYLGDILDVNGQRYPLDILRADAGEMTTRPVLSAGRFNFGPEGKQAVSLSIQEAEVLKDLYASGNVPTAREIRAALTNIEAPKVGKGLIYESIATEPSGVSVRTEKRLNGDGSVSTRETRTNTAGTEESTSWRKTKEVYSTPEEFEKTHEGMGFTTSAKGETRPKPITASRAELIKQYVDEYSQKVTTPIQRPLPNDTPELRAAARFLRSTNIELSQTRTQLDELERAIAGDRRRLDIAAKAYNPEQIVRQELQKESDALSKATQNLSLKNPKRIAATNRMVQIDDVLSGKTPMPEEFIAAAKERFPAPDNPAIKSRLTQNEEEWRLLTQKAESLQTLRANHLGKPLGDVPVDPNDQMRLLMQQFGTEVDKLPTLPPSVAQETLARYEEEVTSVIQRTKHSISLEKNAQAAQQDLIDAVKSGLTGGRVPPSGLITDASQALRAWRAALAERDLHPGGIAKPTTAVESMSNYAKLAELDAYHASLPARNPEAVFPMNFVDNLKNVGDKTFGPGARPFIVVDNARVYGSIRSVLRVGTDSDEWVVDFLPDFAPSRGIIPEVRIKDISLEYKRGDKFDAITKRYDHELKTIRSVQSEEQTLLSSSTPISKNAAEAMIQNRQRLMGSMTPLTVTDADIRDASSLNQNVTDTWDAFQKTLLPLAPGDIGTVRTRVQELERLGFVDMANAPTPKTKVKAAQTVEARQAVVTDYRDYTEAAMGFTWEDPSIKDVVDAAGDPVRLAMQMRGRGITPEAIVQEPSLRNTLSRFPRIQGAMDFVTGRGFADPRVMGIHTGYHYSRKGLSANIFRIFGGLTDQWRKFAIEDFAKSGDPRTTMRPKGLRFSYGDEELSATLSKHFDPTPKASWDPKLTDAMEKIQALPDDVRTELLDRISREHRWLMDYPELFPSLPEEYKKVGAYGLANIKRLSDIAALDGGAGVSQGYLNRLMLSSELYDQVDAKLLSEGHPLAVLAEAAKVSQNINRPLSDMLVSGDNLLRAEPLAYWNASLMHRITQQVKDLKDPLGPALTEGPAGDIFHTANRWSIKSLDKFKVRNPDGTVSEAATKELHESLKQLEQGLNRTADWRGLSRLSQSVASVVLSLDANIVSVQGYAAIASKMVHEMGAGVVTGHPFRAFKATQEYVRSLHGVMSDEGFHGWYKTRADDIQYYSSLGMSIGQEAFIAGPALNKMPLESVPFFGRLPKTMREFNDLQFNRLLLFMKVSAIDSQLEKAKLFRAIGPTGSAGWLRGLTGIKDTVDQMAGESHYLQGEPEDVVKAAIRATNNKLGGVDLNAQGIVQWRQTAEQIMMITPGFFRSQAGMISTALTRPHSVEGWMAITGIAEEVAFAAGVATLIGAATGNTHKINYTDIRRADWMAVPFDNSYIPIIPRQGIPRLGARVLSAVVSKAQGDGFDAGPSIDAFARARLSPLVNATLGPAFFDTDFLGRRYRDKKDRVFAAITALMPIMAQNITTDARENVAQSGWSSLGPSLAQTPLQFLGKNLVPRAPIDKLDDIAKQYTSSTTPNSVRGWYDLTKSEQEILLQNPSTQSAKDNLDYYQQRRQSPKEQQVEAAFQQADQRTTQLRTQPIHWPDGTVTTMAQLYELLQAGQIDGDEYRKKYQFVNGKINEVMQGMETNLQRLGFDLGQSHEDRIARLREVFKGSDANAILTQMAVWDSEQVQPDNYLHDVVVQTDNGPVTLQETDWDKFQEDKKAALDAYPTNIQLSAQSVTDKWKDPGVDAYRLASQKRTLIEDMQRYKGLDNTQADKVDAMLKSFRDLNDMLRVKIGLPGSVAPLPRGLQTRLRAYAVRQFAQQGFLKTRDDIKLASIALMMAEKSTIKDAMTSTNQMAALIQNPDVLMFYPYLMGRVPLWLRGKLPENLQPQFNVQNQYARLAG